LVLCIYEKLCTNIINRATSGYIRQRAFESADIWVYRDGVI